MKIYQHNNSLKNAASVNNEPNQTLQLALTILSINSLTKTSKSSGLSIWINLFVVDDTSSPVDAVLESMLIVSFLETVKTEKVRRALFQRRCLFLCENFSIAAQFFSTKAEADESKHRKTKYPRMLEMKLTYLSTVYVYEWESGPGWLKREGRSKRRQKMEIVAEFWQTVGFWKNQTYFNFNLNKIHRIVCGIAHLIEAIFPAF